MKAIGKIMLGQNSFNNTFLTPEALATAVQVSADVTIMTSLEGVVPAASEAAMASLEHIVAMAEAATTSLEGVIPAASEAAMASLEGVIPAASEAAMASLEHIAATAEDPEVKQQALGELRRIKDALVHE
jgi:hypothetical protein